METLRWILGDEDPGPITEQHIWDLDEQEIGLRAEEHGMTIDEYRHGLAQMLPELLRRDDRQLNDRIPSEYQLPFDFLRPLR
jgi:hypothetical protein